MTMTEPIYEVTVAVTLNVHMFEHDDGTLTHIYTDVLDSAITGPLGMPSVVYNAVTRDLPHLTMNP